MCGVTGMFEYAGRGAPDPDVLRRMLRRIEHRGPDDVGVHEDRGLAFGLQRLSVIDVEGGHQPMSGTLADHVVVCCNGEIYNHDFLRSALRRAGHRFRTRSDTEVVPHLYEEHGVEFLQHLRGMFGIALWDSRRRQLVLARDRLGIKPMYYVDDGVRLVFGSEIKALLAHPAVTATLDPVAVSQYLSLKYAPAPRTMFAGIRALPPGCVLLCGADGPVVRRYWDLDMRSPRERAGAEELAEELERLLRESVQLHLQSDVRFGAFLSGGLDSSLVVALMTEFQTEPVRTFSIGFTAGAQSYGELPYAAAVAHRLHTEHTEVVMSGHDFVASLDEVLWHLDQPIADAAAVPMLHLSRRASQDVKMVLSGEGGDELFAGYARYVGESFAPLLQHIPPMVRSTLLDGLARVAHGRSRIALHALAKHDPVTRMANWFPLFDDDAKRSLLGPALSSAANVRAEEEPFTAALARGLAGDDPLSRMLYCDSALWLPDDLLARGDKMAMAASLELRVPLLDHEVVEFAATVPSSLKLHRLQRKVLLRRVAKGRLPTAVLERPKEGFPLPVAEWFRGEARDMLCDLLAPDVVRRRGLLRPQAVSDLVARHVSGAQDNSRVLFGLLALEVWCRQHLDSGDRAAVA